MTAERRAAPGLTYRDTGVDREAAAQVIAAAAHAIRETFTGRVVGDLGQFGGLFALHGYRDPLLVATIDGVGTKVLLAAQAGRLDVAGHDAVIHGVNDVAVLGATPLFALDYIAAGRFDPGSYAAVLRGAAAACRAEGVALIGGETAQMPGVYQPAAVDVVACVVGAVERSELCDGSAIRPGDALVGMAADGLHTNGYTLARAVLSRKRWDLADEPPGLGMPVGEALLRPHRSYRRPLLALAGSRWLRGAAHITGGGIPGNLVRVLPDGCRARVAAGSWPVPAIFPVLARAGDVADEEMYATTNMGIGAIAVVAPVRAGLAVDICRANGTEAWVIGEVVEGNRGVDIA